MSAVHKFGFDNPHEFVLGMLAIGWEPGDEFLEVLCEQCPDLDPDKVQDWIAEWERDWE